MSWRPGAIRGPWRAAERGRGGFTFVELLSVLVIVSLVAGTAIVGLTSSTESARLETAAASWRDLDACARLFARAQGPVVMSVSADGRRLVLHARGSGELLATRTLPEGAIARLPVEYAADGVVFDALGASPDYDAEVRAGERVMRWHVLGLTGLIVEEGEP